MITKSKITEIFCIADDFCKEFEVEMAKNALPSPKGASKRKRKRTMSDADVMTILICFHFNSYRNFKHYYLGCVCIRWRHLFHFTGRQGLPLAMSEPWQGNHADLYRIKDSVDSMAFQLDRCGVPFDRIFNNADAGFDALDFRNALDKYGIIANVCPNPRNGELSEEYLFDEVIYKEQFAIECTNAWMDSFRSILCRFDTTLSSWKGWNYLVFAVVFLKKFTNQKSLDDFIIKRLLHSLDNGVISYLFLIILN